MSERLSQLGSGADHVRSSSLLTEDNLEDFEMTTRSDTSGKASPRQNLSVRGWRLLDESSGWKPCPIGVYSGTGL